MEIKRTHLYALLLLSMGAPILGGNSFVEARLYRSWIDLGDPEHRKVSFAPQKSGTDQAKGLRTGPPAEDLTASSCAQTPIDRHEDTQPDFLHALLGSRLGDSSYRLGESQLDDSQLSVGVSSLDVPREPVVPTRPAAPRRVMDACGDEYEQVTPPPRPSVSRLPGTSPTRLSDDPCFRRVRVEEKTRSWWRRLFTITSEQSRQRQDWRGMIDLEKGEFGLRVERKNFYSRFKRQFLSCLGVRSK